MTQTSLFTSIKTQVLVNETPKINECFNCENFKNCKMRKEGARGCGDLFTTETRIIESKAIELF